MHVCTETNIRKVLEYSDEMTLYRTGWIKELYENDSIYIYIRGNKELVRKYKVQAVSVAKNKDLESIQEFVEERAMYKRKFHPDHLFIIYKLKKSEQNGKSEDYKRRTE